MDINGNLSIIMATHNILHRYQSRLLLPIGAIENNIDFILGLNQNMEVICSEGEKCSVKFSREIYVLSKEFSELLAEIYGPRVDLLYFLRTWYERCPEINEINFIYLELEEPLK